MLAADGFQSINTGDVYITWAQTVSGTLQIFVAVSHDSGATFTTTQLSTAGGITPALAGWGGNVYVTWYQNSACPETALNQPTGSPPTTSGCINVVSSSDDGKTWSTPVELNPSLGGEPQIVASGNYAYIVADGVYFSSFGLGGTWTGNGTTSTGWTTPENLYSIYTYGTDCITFTSCVYTFGRETWIAGSGLDVYVTFNAIDLSSNPSGTPIYRVYGLTSNDGGNTWYSGTSTSASNKLTSFPPVITTPADQQKFLMSGTIRTDWEPENIANGHNSVLTFHSLSNQGIYMISTNNDGSTWSSPQLISGTGSTNAFAHVYSSDGINVFVMWGQKISSSSSVWNAYISYSANNGTAWSAPIDISNNAAGVAAGNLDVTLFALSSNGAHCFAAWTYTNTGTSQIYFASS